MGGEIDKKNHFKRGGEGLEGMEERYFSKK